MASEKELHAFVAATFRSVWALEVLCHLRARRGQFLPQAEIVSALRASDLIVEQSLTSLAAAGLVAVDENGAATYAPASEATDVLVAATEALYAKSPNAVRRTIVRAANPSISAFAAAFKFRSD